MIVTLGVVAALVAPVAAASAATSPSVNPNGAPVAVQNAAQDAYQAKEAGDRADPGLTPGTGRGLSASSLQASALTGSEFNAGDIISDNNFYGSVMTATQVQSELTALGGKCADTSGLACLSTYTTTSRTIAADSVCNGYTGASGQTAATIIATVGASCGISQRVLIVLLQKESGLVTSTNPTAGDYETATGYGCPDTSGCDTAYYGLFNQLFLAAWQLKDYETSTIFTYYPVGKTTAIAYSPTASCGKADVDIWNSATAALYYYTPFQPNAAALSNLSGTGNSCSSYGNRNFWTIYNAWFGSPTAGQSPTIARESGSDRYATAVAISQAAYPTAPVPAVFIATGTDFPDALSAAPAAAVEGGPLLLVSPTAIPSEVTTELARLKPSRIYVVGGTGAVSAAVYNELAATPGLTKIFRVAGADRYATSQAIARDFFPNPGSSTVYLATGADFPDALSAGAVAGHAKDPVLLVDGAESSVDAATLATLSTLKATRAVIVGGTGVVSSAFQTSLQKHVTTVTRESGADRYATSAAVNAGTAGAAKVYLATGADFPDALAGAAAAGASGSPLYVVEPTCLPSESFDGLFSTSLGQAILLGGTGALSASVAGLEACV